MYASVTQVEQRLNRTFTNSETNACEAYLEDAAIIIDTFAPDAPEDRKNLVSIRMVMRAMGDGESTGFPMGATQGSMSGLGYAQSWTIGSGGSNSEVYLSSMEKQLLGMGNRIGSHSPIEDNLCVAQL